MDDTSFGKYRLIAELGHGGMADVFLAVAEGPAGSGFSKLTVIKRLRKNLAEDPEFVTMLVDEARIAARLNHPNVVQTNEVGQVGKHYFIAMEHLDGQPLHRIQLRATMEGGLPKPLSYLALADSLAGLHHAHELKDYDDTPLQIVHRDVTPHNLFVTYDGQVKVVDFGIAKAVGRASETRQGLVKGKVRYMGPEQAMGGAIDRRADLFSVGIILWEMATGRRMWRDKDEADIVAALVGGEVPRSPKAAAPDADIPDAIDRICQKALARWVEERYATADELRTEIEQHLADTGQLLDARRKLGPFVAKLFEDDRNEMKSVLEAQLTRLTSKSAEFRTVFIPLDTTSNATPSSNARLGRPLRSEDGTKSAVTQGTVTEAATTAYFRDKPSRKKQIMSVTGVVGAIALGGGILVAVTHRTDGISAGTTDQLAPSAIEVPSTPSAPSPSTLSGGSTVAPFAAADARPEDSVASARADSGPVTSPTTSPTTSPITSASARSNTGPNTRPTGAVTSARPSGSGDFSGFGGRK